MLEESADKLSTQKKRRINGCLVTFIGFLLLPFFIVGILGLLADYRQSLPNGYRVVYCSSKNAVILSPSGEWVVGPHISNWNINGIYVSGLCVAETPTRSLQKTEEWFLLNTSNGNVINFDTKSNLDQFLEKNNQPQP